MMQRKKIDANQKSIVTTLRSIGALVHSTASIGNGFPDIVVGFRGKVYLFEIKDGTKPVSAQALTEHERKFHQLWNGYVHIVDSADSVLRILFQEIR